MKYLHSILLILTISFHPLWASLSLKENQLPTIPEKNNIAIYPNPAKTYCYLSIDTEIEGKVEIKIFNLLGREIGDQIAKIEKIEKNKKQIDLSKLEEGIYFVKVIFLGQIKTSNKRIQNTIVKKLIIRR